MPRSTGGGYSPDGIFGQETKEVVKRFQASKHLKDDGIVGRDTMKALDAALRRPKHRVRLYFYSISMTNVPFQQAFQNAQRVYAQYGIDVEFGFGQSLWLNEEQAALFDKINQECEWDLSSGEYDQLHRLGPSAPPDAIKVYFANRLRGVLGCGGHAPRRPAATVAREAWRWDMAHEVGHVLLTSTYSPVHHPHRLNLMNSHPANDNVVKVLTDSQVRQMRRHPCCVAMA